MKFVVRFQVTSWLTSRLTFHTISPGLFRFEERLQSFSVVDGLELTVQARDADKLAEAKRYHIEARGFPNKDAARSAGERLRVRLQILNAMLGLGISVPVEDATSGGFSEGAKTKLLQEHGIVAQDSVIGLAVWPGDGKHTEYVFACEANTFPSDPAYLFAALTEIWPIEMQMDERSEDALRFLNLATTEQSPRGRFLLTYLAVERMVRVRKRSDAAIGLIRQLEDRVEGSELAQDDKVSLLGSLRRLYERSVTSELKDLGRRVQTDDTYCGLSIQGFLSKCSETRHKIAHGGKIPQDNDLICQADGLRKFCRQLGSERNSECFCPRSSIARINTRWCFQRSSDVRDTAQVNLR